MITFLLALQVSQSSSLPSPPALLEVIRRDLRNRYGTIDCPEPLEQHLRVQSLKLNSRQEMRIMQTKGACLAAPQNGPILVYLRSGQEWNLALEAWGQSIRSKPTRGVSPPDLYVQEFVAATESIQIHYRFAKGKYLAIACQEHNHPADKTGKITKRLQTGVCEFDWEANIKER